MNKHLAILRKGVYEVAPVLAILGLVASIFAVTFWAFNWAINHHHLPAMITTWSVVLLTSMIYLAGLD
jgi:hypothetical protein